MSMTTRRRRARVPQPRPAAHHALRRRATAAQAGHPHGGEGQRLMAHTDWIIDLGPGAGHDGGRIVFEGTPADLVAASSILTGEHQADYVGRPEPLWTPRDEAHLFRLVPRGPISDVVAATSTGTYRASVGCGWSMPATKHPTVPQSTNTTPAIQAYSGCPYQNTGFYVV